MQWDASGFPSGIYYITVKADQYTEVIRVLKR
jgi:hypothetical protein